MQQKGRHHAEKIPFVEGKISLDHPKIGGFQTALHRLRPSINDVLSPILNITLPYPVETEIDNEQLS